MRKTVQNLSEDSKHQIAVSLLRGQRHGNLIFVSSIQGVSSPKLDHHEGLDMFSPIEYSIGKSGVISAKKYLAKYFGNEVIRVNAISTGGLIRQSKRGI